MQFCIIFSSLSAFPEVVIVPASIETTPKRYICQKIHFPDNCTLYEVITEIVQLTFFKSSLFLTRTLYEQASWEIEKIIMRLYLSRFARRFEVSASGILMTLRGSKNFKVVPYIQFFYVFVFSKGTLSVCVE